MAKPSKKKRGVSLTQSKYFRTGALALVGLIALGSAFAATSGDLVYGGKSLLAAVIGGIDTTPRITIARDTYTSSAAIWPGAEQNLAQFSVKPRYLGAYGYLRSFKASVQIDSKTAALYAGRIGARFVTCNTTACIETPLSASTPVASTTSKGLLYSFQGGMTPQVGSGVTGTLVIYGTPYYGSIYAASSSPSANIKAQIEAADGAGLICAPVYGVRSCSWKSVPVETALAYGNWLKVNRGSGYAYGYWDINNSASLTASDADRVLKVAVGTLACPFSKKCDIDQSGRVTATDANLLLKYAVGSLPPPGTATTTPATTTLIVAELSGTPKIEVRAGDPDNFTATIPFQVVAPSRDIWIAKSVTQGEKPALGKMTWAVRGDSTAAVMYPAGTMSSVTGSLDYDSPTGFKVPANTTRKFVFTATGAASTTGFVGVQLTGIGYDTDSVVDSSSQRYFMGLDTFKTSLVKIVNPM